MRELSKPNRRDFLQGRAAVGVLQDLADQVATPEQFTLPEPRSGYLLRVGRRAMACPFEVLLNAGQYEHGSETALAALDLVDGIESQLTVFRDDSELAQINQTAHRGPVEVEPRLFAILARAAEIHRRTAGAYDITSGPLTKAWGFFRQDGRVPTEAEIQQAIERVGMRHLQLDEQRHSVQFGRPGLEINLGSIGKGYALDRMAEVLLAAGVEDFLLHGGNSSVLGRGNCGFGGDGTEGWWIGLRNPLQPDQRIGEIRLLNRALGTSGSGTQFFLHQGQRYGHILDPRTGRPAEGTLSVTVAAPTGADADALATAFYVLGLDAALQYCLRHPGLSVVMITPAKQSGQMLITLYGLADGDWKLLVSDDTIVVRRAD